MPYKNREVRNLRGREYTRKYREANREKCNAATMRYRRTEEGKQSHAIANARYRKRNPDKVKALFAVVDKLPHRVAYRKEWKKAHPDIIYKSNRKAALKRKLALAVNGGTCTTAQWYARVAYYGGRCAYCEKPLTRQSTEIDHVIPVTKGGTGWPSNLVPACRRCNAVKHNNFILPARLNRYMAEQQMGLGMMVSTVGRKPTAQAPPSFTSQGNISESG